MGGMKESIRRERKIPKFNPLPVNLRKERHGVPDTSARFYGNFKTKSNQIKRFGFQIKIPHYASGKMKQKMIAFTYQRLVFFKSVPIHRKGETFTFGELMQRTSWIRVKRVRNCGVDVKS
jgi:hypothetical protein